VKGINIVTKHNRPSQANPDGGITHEEAPIHISNVAYLDPVTKKPTRIGYQIVDGKKVRVAKASGTIIDK
jgi:large subunit ribosomal protein L24